MYQAHTAIHTPGSRFAGENAVLQVLFFKLTRLLRNCVIPIFVFDGPCHPSVKREKNVVQRRDWLADYFKQLIAAFGFHVHQASFSRHSKSAVLTKIFVKAPGEAEAELAQLNAKGMIDAVLTDDSDAFIFGATHVIRTR